jgi:hypothetical protein
MKSLACVLAGALIAAFAAGSVRAESTSTNLSVTVTVVAPGSLAGTDSQTPAPARSTSQRPATTAPAEGTEQPAE